MGQTMTSGDGCSSCTWFYRCGDHPDGGRCGARFKNWPDFTLDERGDNHAFVLSDPGCLVFEPRFGREEEVKCLT